MRPFDTISTSITESLASIAVFDVSNISKIFIQIDVATNALDQFEILCRPNSNASYNSFYSASVDYTSPKGILIGVSGDLTVIASAGWLMIDVRSIDSIQLKAASGNAGGSTTTVYAGAN